ncbi:MAG: right-handed parallel beta-helix repeat-containing protein, partial [Candidatus Thorarchaeota archaeon]
EIGIDLVGAILINCSHLRIEELNGNFVEVHHSDDVVIRNCDVSHGGIRVSYGENVTIASCEISDTPLVNKTFNYGYSIWGLLGITVYSSANTLVVNNKLDNTGRGGIDIFHSIPARVIGNEINGSGIEGISLWQTRDALVTGNLVNNSWGHSISLSQVSRSEIYLNQFDITGNSSAIILDSSQITWHNGAQGNYWIEYDGTDGDSDGIGDTPFGIDSENTDPYPLVTGNSISEHKDQILSTGPQILNVSVAPEVLYSNGNVTINVTAYAEYSLAYVILSFSLDNGLTWTNVTMTCIEGIWTTTLENVPEGTLLCRVYVIDSLGNHDEVELDVISVSSFLGVSLMIGIAGIGVVAVLALVFMYRKKTMT